MLYKIYAGLAGSYGGCRHVATASFDTKEEAIKEAHHLAVEEYLGKEGRNGLPSWYDIRDDIMRSFPNDDFDDEDFNYFYEEHREAWLSYRVEECIEE